MEQKLFRSQYNPQEHTGTRQLCPICLDGYIRGNELIYLPCDGLHYFHANCVVEWLRQRSVCPVCRQDVTPARIASANISETILRERYGED